MNNNFEEYFLEVSSSEECGENEGWDVIIK